METLEKQIEGAQAEVERLDAKVRSYNGGDRPMSPPVALIRDRQRAEGRLRELRRLNGEKNIEMIGQAVRETERRRREEQGGHETPPERLCVAALVLNDGVTDPEARDWALLVRSKHPGRAWELPGGGIEGHEAPPDAIRREVREETGIGIAAFAKGPPVELRGTPKPGAAYGSRIFVYRALGHGLPWAGDDADSAAWFPRHEVRRLAQDAQLSDLETRKVLLAWAEEDMPPAPEPPEEHGPELPEINRALGILLAAEALEAVVRESRDVAPIVGQFCDAIGGEAGAWLRERTRLVASMIKRSGEHEAEANLFRARLSLIGQLFGIDPWIETTDDISVKAKLDARELERYELGLRHGALLTKPSNVIAQVPVDDLARAIWETQDRHDTFDQVLADHRDDPDGSVLAIVRREAEAVRHVLVTALNASTAEQRKDAPDLATAFGRLEALCEAGPVELRAAWNEFMVARAAEPSEERARLETWWAVAEMLGAPYSEDATIADLKEGVSAHCARLRAAEQREIDALGAVLLSGVTVPTPSPDGLRLAALQRQVRAVEASMGNLVTLGAALGDLFKMARGEASRPTDPRYDAPMAKLENERTAEAGVKIEDGKVTQWSATPDDQITPGTEPDPGAKPRVPADLYDAIARALEDGDADSLLALHEVFARYARAAK